MSNSETLLNIIVHITNQSEFIFDKLVTWFIFYCTLNLTALVSGYLSILKNEKVSNPAALNNMNQLLYWGSVAFYLSTFISVIGCIITIVYFSLQQRQVKMLAENIQLNVDNSLLFEPQFYTFSIIAGLFTIIILLFSLIWFRVRKRNNFENPFMVILFKKHFIKEQ